MHLSKKISLTLLAVTALLGSRSMFAFFDDPEGPNLLIVVVTAGVVYALSFTVFLSSLSESKKLPLAILVQLLILTTLAYLGRL
jgi:hypothetical protein